MSFRFSSSSFMPEVGLARRMAASSSSGAASRGGGGGRGRAGLTPVGRRAGVLSPVSVYDRESSPPGECGGDGRGGDDGGGGGWHERLGGGGGREPSSARRNGDRSEADGAIDSIWAGRDDGGVVVATAGGGGDDGGSVEERRRLRQKKRDDRKRKERERTERSRDAIEVVDDDDDLIDDDGGGSVEKDGVDWRRSGSSLLGADLEEDLDAVRTPPERRRKKRPPRRGTSDGGGGDEASSGGVNNDRRQRGNRNVGSFMGHDAEDANDLLGVAEERQRADRGDLTSSSSRRRAAPASSSSSTTTTKATAARKRGKGFSLGASPSRNLRGGRDDVDGEAPDGAGGGTAGGRTTRPRGANAPPPSSRASSADGRSTKLNKLGMTQTGWGTDPSEWTGGNLWRGGSTKSTRRRRNEGQQRQRKQRRQRQLWQQQRQRQHRTPKASAPLSDRPEVFEVDDESDADDADAGDDAPPVVGARERSDGPGAGEEGRRRAETPGEEDEEEANANAAPTRTTTDGGEARGRGGRRSPAKDPEEEEEAERDDDDDDDVRERGPRSDRDDDGDDDDDVEPEPKRRAGAAAAGSSEGEAADRGGEEEDERERRRTERRERERRENGRNDAKERRRRRRGQDAVEPIDVDDDDDDDGGSDDAGEPLRVGDLVDRLAGGDPPKPSPPTPAPPRPPRPRDDRPTSSSSGWRVGESASRDGAPARKEETSAVRRSSFAGGNDDDDEDDDAGGPRDDDGDDGGRASAAAESKRKKNEGAEPMELCCLQEEEEEGGGGDVAPSSSSSRPGSRSGGEPDNDGRTAAAATTGGNGKSNRKEPNDDDKEVPMDLCLQEEEDDIEGDVASSPWNRSGKPDDRTAAATRGGKLNLKKQNNKKVPMDLCLQEEDEEEGDVASSPWNRGGKPDDRTAAATRGGKLNLKKQNNKRTNRKGAAKKITPGASLGPFLRKSPEGHGNVDDDIESFSSHSTPGGTDRRRRAPLRNSPSSRRHRDEIAALRREELRPRSNGLPGNGRRRLRRSAEKEKGHGMGSVFDDVDYGFGSLNENLPYGSESSSLRYKKRAGKSTGIPPGSFHAKSPPSADATFSPRSATSGAKAKNEPRRRRLTPPSSHSAERGRKAGILPFTTPLRRSGRLSRGKRNDGGRDDAIEISDDSSSAEVEFEFDGGDDDDKMTEEKQIQIAKNESIADLHGLPSRKGKRRTFGNRHGLDVIRIAIGKKVISSGCKFSFQPGSTKDQYIHFEYNHTPSPGRVNNAAAFRSVPSGNGSREVVSGPEVWEHRISLGDIEALHYYLADEVEEAKLCGPDRSPRDNDSTAAEAMSETEPNRRRRQEYDPMSFIAMRVLPRKANGLTAYSSSYLQSTDFVKESDACKRYIVFEIRSDDEFRQMLRLMRDDGQLKSFVESGMVKPDGVDPYIGALLEDNRLDEQRRLKSASSPGICTRMRTGKLRSAGGSSSSSRAGLEDETLLVYPFSADPDELERAARGLCEASVRDVDVDRETNVGGQEGAVSSSGSDAGVESGGSGKSTKGAVSGRTHYLTIREEDVARLEPGEFLNDTLVDFWMRWIRRHEGPTCDHSVHIFTSHFYTTLCEDGPRGVASWTAKKNIDVFSKKFIFIPINESLHWSLCVVTNPGKILNAFDPDGADEDECPCMFFFDSLKAHRKVWVAKNVRSWLNFLWDQPEKDPMKAPFDSDSMQVHDPKIPYQSNSWDCGVFVCRYAFGLYRLRHQKITYAEQYERHRWITKSDEFGFNMRDIARLRREMKILVSNLSKIYIDAKKKETEAKRAKKIKANRDTTSGKGKELIDKEAEEHGSHEV